jgi:hypothetical protein
MTDRRARPGPAFGGWILAAVLLFTALPGWGAERERADLYLWLEAGGGAEAALRLGFQPARSLPLEQSLSRALGAPLREAHWDDEDGEPMLRARAERVFRRQGWSLAGQVDPVPLARLLRPLGVQWLTVNLNHSPLGVSHCTGARRVPSEDREEVSYFAAFLTDEAMSPIRLAFGYQSLAVWRSLACFLALLLAPIGLTLRMRGRTLRAAAADRALAWFHYWRFLRYLNIATLLACAAAAFGLKIERYAAFLLGRGGHTSAIAVAFGVALLPAALVISVCGVLSHPVYARVRGMEWTRGDLVRQSSWGLGAALLPALLMLAGMDAAINGDPRVGVFCFALALLSGVALRAGGSQVLGMTPAALTTGELRDRIFALAEKAGVKVQQVYLLPAVKGRMANAFAMQGNNVLLTDYLLQHLSRREVDAIVAHELAHLQRRDPRRLQAALALAIAVPVGLGVGLDAVGVLGHQPGIIAAGGGLLGLLLFYFIARRLERRADAGAVALTGDPESMITGLAKLMQINLMPMQWGRWDERLLTHPSTLRRVQAIARQGGIPPERLQELLGQLGADPDRYEVPPSVLDEGRLFSTRFKGQVALRNGWTLLAVMALTPSLVAWLAGLLPVSSGARWVVIGVGLAATVALYLAVLNIVPLWGYGELQRRLRARLERDGRRPEAMAARFVGFAPSAALRLYESFFDWDVGFLFIDRDRLCYLGEQTSFALPWEQVAAIDLAPGSPSWWRSPRVRVTWTDAPRGSGGSFTLRPAEARSLRQLARDGHAFAKQLQAWRQQPPDPRTPSTTFADLAEPELGTVTSLSPRVLASPRVLIRMLFYGALLSLGASVLLGLSFDLPAGTAWPALLSTYLVCFVHWLPFARYHEPSG